MPDPTPQQVLGLALPGNDSGAFTVRGYLCALLAELWREEDGFSGKRPFGNSGWPDDIYGPMVRAGMVEGAFDEDGDLEIFPRASQQKADKLIQAAIARLKSEDADLERLRSSARTLATVTASLSRALKAAWIELVQGHSDAAREWIANAIEDCWDGDEWDGTESAQQWLDRTEAPASTEEGKRS